MANANKNKGKGFESQISDMFAQVTKLNWQRVPNSGAFIGGKNVNRIQSMSANQIQLMRGDIIPPEEFNGVCIECKFHKDFAFHQLFDNSKTLDAWISQCLIDYNRSNGKFFAVIFKINHKGSFICCFENQIKQEKGLDYIYNDAENNKIHMRVYQFDKHFLNKHITTIKSLCSQDVFKIY